MLRSKDILLNYIIDYEKCQVQGKGYKIERKYSEGEAPVLPYMAVGEGFDPPETL
jgi:hypothetical protein